MSCPSSALRRRRRRNYDWAKPWDCQRVGVEGGALEIVGESFHGLGGACSLTNPVELRGMDSVLNDLACPERDRAKILLNHAFGLCVITDAQVLDRIACEK